MKKEEFKQQLIDLFTDYYSYLKEKDYYNDCQSDYENMSDFFDWLKDGYVWH